MTSFSDLVPIPPKDQMNTNLSAAREATMLKVLGKPGKLTRECSAPTAAFRKRCLSGVDVGPFPVDGLAFAVESLKQVFDEVAAAHPQIVREVRTEGMLCIRARRHNPSRFSNHSWGAAIDLKFGPRVVDQGIHRTQRGFLELFPIFNKHGWYWGAEFSGDSVDSMHFELAEETILKLGNG